MFLIFSIHFIDCIDEINSRQSQNLQNHHHNNQQLGLFRRKIYFDFGSNNGDSISTFIRNVNFAAPSSSSSVAHDGSQSASADFFKDVDSLKGYSKWELYAFEPNSRYLSMLSNTKKRILDAYGNITQSVELFTNCSVTTHNGEVVFILDNNHDGDAGSTVEADSFSAVGKKMVTKAYDIVDIFRNIVKVKVHDYVIVKVDIEGHEYELVRRMILFGLLPYVDKIAVEWHHSNPWVFGGPDSAALNSTDAAALKKAKARAAINTKYSRQYDHIMWMIEGDPHIKGKFCDWGR